MKLFLLATKWYSTILSYFFQNVTTDLPADVTKADVARAFKVFVTSMAQIVHLYRPMDRKSIGGNGKRKAGRRNEAGGKMEGKWDEGQDDF